MQCKVMSEIRWIHTEIKWAQIESAISRGRHTDTSLFTSRAAVHLPWWICVKMKEILIDSCGCPLHGWSLNTKASRRRRCIFVFVFAQLFSCTLAMPGWQGLLPHARTSHQPVWPPTLRTLQTRYWLITEVKKLWTYTAGIRKSPAEPAGLNKRETVTCRQQICHGNKARRCLSLAYSLLKQLSESALLCGY